MKRKSKYPITNTEDVEQATLISWANMQSGKFPELKLLYHIPNGGSRNTMEAANLKRQGVKAGVPDLCLPVARGKFHGLYIEMKAKRNTPSTYQKEWIKNLNEQNYYAQVCWGWEQASEVIKQYLQNKIK